MRIAFLKKPLCDFSGRVLNIFHEVSNCLTECENYFSHIQLLKTQPHWSSKTYYWGKERVLKSDKCSVYNHDTEHYIYYGDTLIANTKGYS